MLQIYDSRYSILTGGEPVGLLVLVSAAWQGTHSRFTGLISCSYVERGRNNSGEQHPSTDAGQVTNGKYHVPATREHLTSHETGEKG